MADERKRSEEIHAELPKGRKQLKGAQALSEREELIGSKESGRKESTLGICADKALQQVYNNILHDKLIDCLL